MLKLKVGFQNIQVEQEVDYQLLLVLMVFLVVHLDIMLVVAEVVLIFQEVFLVVQVE